MQIGNAGRAISSLKCISPDHFRIEPKLVFHVYGVVWGWGENILFCQYYFLFSLFFAQNASGFPAFDVPSFLSRPTCLDKQSGKDFASIFMVSVKNGWFYSSAFMWQSLNAAVSMTANKSFKKSNLPLLSVLFLLIFDMFDSGEETLSPSLRRSGIPKSSIHKHNLSISYIIKCFLC